MSPLVTCGILEVFVNILIADDMWEFATSNTNAIIRKIKDLSAIFCSISGIYIKS